MNEDTKANILKWIAKNQISHDWVIQHEEDDEMPVCDDGYDPYVNSAKLKGFIDKLGPNETFDLLPGMKILDGVTYHPIVKKDCDGYFSAYYVADDGSFIFSDGTGYATPELALGELAKRLSYGQALL